MAVSEALSDEEAYLFAILTDESGLDLAEYAWVDEETPDSCFRAWPFQWCWWRDDSPLQIDQAARAVGKSLSIKARAFAFPFCHPGQEMLITAPELVHLEPITGLIERQFYDTRLGREIIPHGRSAVTHRPFQMNFLTGTRIVGRIPQISGRGVKGSHPIALEQDECFPRGTLVLTKHGLMPIEDIAIGEEVLTHKRRWRKVTATMTRERPTVRLRGHGHPGLVVSAHHKFWAARTDTESYIIDSEGLVPRRTVNPRQWIEASLMEGNWWSSPTVYPQVKHVPSFRKPGTNGSIPCGQDSDNFFWMVGLWLAEGSYSPKGRKVAFSVADHEVEYVEKQLRGLGLTPYRGPSVDGCVTLYVCNTVLGEWLHSHFGRGAHHKSIPPWCLGLKREYRTAILEGLVYGDGFDDPDPRYSEGRWKLTTVSKALAISARMLALTLDHSVSLYWNDLSKRELQIRGRAVRSDGFYQVVGNMSGQGFTFDHLRYSQVRQVDQTGLIEKLYDLTVEEDHSFIADGICVSNSQDYPEAGWIELIETLKRGSKGATWRAHGVTKGIRDKFYEYTQPESNWKVHRITAMARPNWTDQERQEKMELYGSRDDPDYRRNVLGLHGDSSQPLFVLARLMKCVSPEGSDYNENEYQLYSIKAEMLEDIAGPIQSEQAMAAIQILDFPASHKRYRTFWCGADIGMTTDPTEILVFAEETPSAAEIKAAKASRIAVPEGGMTRLKLLTRIDLQRISNPTQARIMEWVIDFYKPAAFALDKTGLGLGLFQDLQAKSLDLARVVKGYNFSEKVIVDIDGTVHIGELDDVLKEAAIRSNVLERSTDVLRELVDNFRLLLPWDKMLIKEFQGQTWQYAKSSQDQYGRPRRTFSKGKYHNLDAARMAAMAHSQHTIEAFIEQHNSDDFEPIFDIFIPG